MGKALSVNKGLVVLDLFDNPLGEKSIQQLIGSLQHNHVLQRMELPEHWREFFDHCDGYNEAKNRVTQ